MINYPLAANGVFVWGGNMEDFGQRTMTALFIGILAWPMILFFSRKIVEMPLPVYPHKHAGSIRTNMR